MTVPSPPTFAAVIASDLDASVAWYGRVLGLRLRDRSDRPDRGFRVANLTYSRLWHEVIQRDDAVPRDRALAGFAQGSRPMGWTKVGWSVADIDAERSGLQEPGVSFIGRTVSDAASGLETFLCADPDGIVWQFFGR